MLSAAYSGIFQATGLLDTARAGIARMSRRITPFGAMLCTAVAASMIACNQTLAILRAHQLSADTEPDGPSCAIDLENSAVVLAPLVPWSIAGAVPLASAGAPEQEPAGRVLPVFDPAVLARAQSAAPKAARHRLT